MTFLFWNIHRNGIFSLVSEAASEHNADVLVLAEHGEDAVTALSALNASTSRPFEFIPSIDRSLPQVYVRFPSEWISVLREYQRQRIITIKPPGVEEIIMSIVHLPSKLHRSNEDQTSVGRNLVELIAEVEKERGHSRTIAMGDFNMSPFESGMLHADALNAVMTRQIASKSSRTVDGIEYPFFYNPMWNVFGDAKGVAGSYHTYPKHYRSEYWHLFDQVLLRPGLLSSFAGDVAILDTVGGTSLLKNGVPDKGAVSDHLPLVFTLNL